MNTLLPHVLSVIRVRPLIAGCLLLTALLGGVNYFLWLKRHEITERHAERRQRGETMLRALANRARIDADRAALQTALAQIDKNLLQEHSMEVNLGYFYKFEKASQVRLIRLNQLMAPPATVHDKFKAIAFSMQLTGSYRNTMTFLRALETGPRILRIRNSSYERSLTHPSEFVLELTVDVLAKI